MYRFKKLQEYAQKHPDYFLIQAYRHVNPIEAPGIKEKLEKLLSKEKRPITEFEADLFFSVYTIYFVMSKDTDLAGILAYAKYIDSLDFISENVFYGVFAITKMGKMRNLIRHFEQTEDWNRTR